MSVHTANFTVEWKPSGSWVDISAFVLSVEGDFETTGNNNGIAFGDSSTAQATIKLDPLRSGTLDTSVWELVPIRATFTVDAHTAKGAYGVIVAFDQDIDTVAFKLEGYQRLISRTRVYSTLFERKPIATKTSASSIEDPTDPDYAAGPINWALWQAGGRPYEQAGTYTSASFYYSLEQGLIAPDVAWQAGDDAWEACLKLVRAAGGQLYQRPDGVIAYVTPLSLAEGATVFSLGHSDYQSVSRSGNAGAVMAQIVVPYQGRYKSGVQDVIDDSTARVVAAGASVTIDLEPRYPLYSLETVGGTQVPATALSATYYDGTVVSQGTGYTHTLSVAAQRVTLLIANVASQPFVIERITLRGTPSAPGEANTITLGSGQPTLTVEPNDFVQTRAHAERLGTMALDFFDQARPIITVSGCLYDPTLQIGDIGAFTCEPWGMADTPVVLLSIKHTETGVQSEYSLVDITGLPKISDFFLVSTSAQVATRRIGY